MDKADLTHIAVLLLLLYCMSGLVSTTKGDLVGYRGLVVAYQPYIVFPSNNATYSSDSLTLNVNFKAWAYANMNYSMTYSLDGRANESLPVVKHWRGDWGIYHGERDYVDGSVKLPALSEGSHTITVFLTLDWAVSDQPHEWTVYTYYDNETVNFTIGQDVTPEPSVVEPPIVSSPVENETETTVVAPSIPQGTPTQAYDTTPPAPDSSSILVGLVLCVVSVGLALAAVVCFKKRKRKV